MKVKMIAPLMAYATVAIGLFGLQNAWATLLAFHIALIGSLFIARPNIPLSILFKSQNLKWIALSVLFSGCSGVGLYFVWPHFGIAEDLPSQLKAIGLTTSIWPGFIAYFGLVNPFIEEYFWRGYLGNGTKYFYLSDFIFAGYHVLILVGKVHLASIIFACAVLTLAAWFWRQISRIDGGLLAAVLGHMAADFSLLLAIYRMGNRL